jgi:hypothetical protein
VSGSPRTYLPKPSYLIRTYLPFRPHTNRAALRLAIVFCVWQPPQFTLAPASRGGACLARAIGRDVDARICRCVVRRAWAGAGRQLSSAEPSMHPHLTWWF